MTRENTTRGFAYMLVGGKHAVQLVVSLYSLRHHWLGPVALIAGDDEAEQICRLCSGDNRLGPVTVVRWDAPKGGGKGLQHANKTRLPGLTPFGETAFLDADTLVVGDPTDLLPEPGSAAVRLTRFSLWSARGRKMRGRIEAWRGIVPELCDRAIGMDLPAINTGTFGLSWRSTEFCREWARLAHLNPVFMADELAAQLIFPDFDHLVLDDRWNASPIFSWDRFAPPGDSDVRVWHGHGWKFIKSDTGWSIWEPFFRRAVSENIAGLAEWSPGRDKRLASRLEDVTVRRVRTRRKSRRK